MDSSDFKSNESFFKKDSPDQKSGFRFAERNTKSVLRSKIRFWIHRKEHTLNNLSCWCHLTNIFLQLFVIYMGKPKNLQFFMKELFNIITLFFLLLLIGFFVYYISFLVCDEINNFCSRKIQVLKVKKLMTDGPQCK